MVSGGEFDQLQRSFETDASDEEDRSHRLHTRRLAAPSPERTGRYLSLPKQIVRCFQDWHFMVLAAEGI